MISYMFAFSAFGYSKQSGTICFVYIPGLMSRRRKFVATTAGWRETASRVHDKQPQRYLTLIINFATESKTHSDSYKSTTTSFQPPKNQAGCLYVGTFIHASYTLHCCNATGYLFVATFPNPTIRCKHSDKFDAPYKNPSFRHVEDLLVIM